MHVQHVKKKKGKKKISIELIQTVHICGFPNICMRFIKKTKKTDIFLTKIDADILGRKRLIEKGKL